MPEAFPLAWPDGWPRTSSWHRERARFKVTRDQAQRELMLELERFGARSIVLSTNVPLRRDGLPYAGKANPDDPGVAVYFMREKKQVCIPCDKWDRIQDNMRAISKTIEAMRGMQRWGANNVVDKAFDGFQVLPPALVSGGKWYEVIGVLPNATREEIRGKRVTLARIYHPDSGTEPDNQRMAEINAACDAGLAQATN